MIAIIEVTAKDREQALAIGRTLVHERLAACVNVLDGATSIYEWNGQLCEEREAVLLAKTRHELVEAVIERVQQLHTYECPCIVSWDIAQGSAAYVKWVEEQTNRRSV
jgi:periplasmic divalent cation tolerance protein